MTHPLVASVIIDNYNYGRFLPASIESALCQTYPQTEVIVVDDGSHDNSRDVVARYGSRVCTILKENGGQASAFNAGVRASHGDVIVFLDADDMLLPSALERAVPLFEGDVSKVHWPLGLADQAGIPTGELQTRQPLLSGDLRATILEHGPTALLNPPTSGNAWSRWFLERVLPIPESDYRLGADAYLLALAPLYGHLATVSEPQAYYRVHEHNHFWHIPFDGLLEYEEANRVQLLGVLAQHAQALGLELKPSAFEPDTWVDELRRGRQHIQALIPPRDTFILADDNSWWPGDIAGRHRLPFLERDGQYWGPPLDDSQAIEELERMRRAGATFIAFASPCFWWLEYYMGLRRYLEANFHCALRADTLIVYDMR